VSSSSSAVIDVNDDTFEREVLEHDAPVLVDVWAAWCGPCRLMAPVMDWAAETYGDKLKVVKLEADPNPISRDRHSIQGLPTLILFMHGQELWRHEGVMTQALLRTRLDAHI
jgi:thioredoxin 1